MRLLTDHQSLGMRKIRLIVAFAAGLLLSALSTQAAFAEQRPEATINLLPNALVEHAVVRLADIASIEGNNPNLVKQLRELAVTDLAQIGAGEYVKKTRIDYLLLLSGIDDSKVQITGDTSTVMRTGMRTVDDRVTFAVAAEFARKLGVPQSDIKVQLTRPLAKYERVLRLRNVELRAFPIRTARLGSNAIRMGIYGDNRLVQTFSAPVDVGILRNVPVTKRIITRDMKLSADDYEWKRLAIRELDYLPKDTDLVDRQLTVRLNPGDVIRPGHIRKQSAVKQPFVVNKRDNVKVIAQKGKLRVTLGGAVALDRGRVGDTIRLKNPTSEKVLTAKLISPNTAVTRF